MTAGRHGGVAAATQRRWCAPRDGHARTTRQRLGCLIAACHVGVSKPRWNKLNSGCTSYADQPPHTAPSVFWRRYQLVWGKKRAGRAILRWRTRLAPPYPYQLMVADEPRSSQGKSTSHLCSQSHAYRSVVIVIQSACVATLAVMTLCL